MISKKTLGLYLALVHYPVLDRRGETIASAVTNLDLHDLARLSRTYDLRACFIVTPLEDQKALVRRLLSHWCEGVGREVMTDRAEALRCLRVEESIDRVEERITAAEGARPLVWVTSARRGESTLNAQDARGVQQELRRPALILLGTGWGLAPRIMERADAALEPIEGHNGYNHLSVRCAAAILLDRFYR